MGLTVFDMAYQYLLAFHIIGFIVWMAGLFYWIRIMVYQSETGEAIVLAQLQTMSERLYRFIIVPGMILTWGMGLALMVLTEAYRLGWFHFKFLLVILLTGYQFNGLVLMRRYRRAAGGEKISLPAAKRMRIYNELATFLMVGIVFAVVLREFSLIAVGYGIFILLVVMGFGGYWVRRRRG